MNIAPTQSNLTEALRSFLLAVLPTGTVVLVAQQNRTPEPRAPNFLILTPMRFRRLRTNIDGYEDVIFTGSIAGAMLSVSDVALGTIKVGATVFGTGVIANTTITALGTGSGGPGTYAISPSQTIPSQQLSSGAKTVEQGAEIVVQMDFHSADTTTAGDMAQIVSTLLRDPYGVSYFAGLAAPLNGVIPLYADDPTQRPFINDQQQYEWRWVLEAMLQMNQVVSLPQQFADSASVDVISVDASYPP